MRILISGGSGMIGTALARSLLADGHQVWVLTRNVRTVVLPEGVTALGWDGKTGLGWRDVLSQVDAVVNLVGESLSRWPWTKEQQQRFWDSRVAGGRALAEAIRVASPRPQVLIQASGANYYGPRDLAPVTETDAPGSDYLSELCKAWEASTQPVEALGVRRVIVRSGVVLSAHEGILPIMLLPVKFFVGGPLGGGRQGFPWIHIDDEVAAIRFLLENPKARGAFNLTAPILTSSADFIRVIAKTLRRPYWLPAPAFALRMALGGMATLVLDGMYLLPGRLQELGFPFRFATPEAALRDLLAG